MVYQALFLGFYMHYLKLSSGNPYEIGTIIIPIVQKRN